MMKKIQKWSICLLAVTMLLALASCELPFNVSKDTEAESVEETVTTENVTPEETETEAPDTDTDTDTDTDEPEETKANIQPGKDEDHTWENYNPFG